MPRRNPGKEEVATRLSRPEGEKGRDKQEEGQRDLEKRWGTEDRSKRGTGSRTTVWRD